MRMHGLVLCCSQLLCELGEQNRQYHLLHRIPLHIRAGGARLCHLLLLLQHYAHHEKGKLLNAQLMAECGRTPSLSLVPESAFETQS